MKASLILGLLFLLAPAGVRAEEQSALRQGIDKAEAAYRENMNAARTGYRKAFAEAIKGATRVEVYLLEPYFLPPADTKDAAWAKRLPKDEFPVIPFAAKATILARRTLTADEIVMMIPALRKMISAENRHSGLLCHEPIHGIRVWEGEEMIFQTSLCYRCHNFYMTYPSDEAEMAEFSSPELEEVMRKLMPIPKKEEDGK